MNAALDRDYAAAVSELLRHGHPVGYLEAKAAVVARAKTCLAIFSTLAGTSISSTPIPCLRFCRMHVFFTGFFLPYFLIAQAPSTPAAPYLPSQDTASY